MEELAESHRLDGCEPSDADVAFGLYYDYRDQISITLGVLSLLLLSVVIFRRRRKLQPAAAGFFLFTALILFAAHLNFGDKHVAGIVGEPNTYLMNGPSAGASDQRGLLLLLGLLVLALLLGGLLGLLLDVLLGFLRLAHGRPPLRRRADSPERSIVPGASAFHQRRPGTPPWPRAAPFG